MKQSNENLVNIFENGVESCKMIIIGLLGFIRFPIRCIDFVLISICYLIGEVKAMNYEDYYWITKEKKRTTIKNR